MLVSVLVIALVNIHSTYKHVEIAYPKHGEAHRNLDLNPYVYYV